MLSSFPAIRDRHDYRRVSSLLRAMRRAARIYLQTRDAGNLNYAVACRATLSFYRVA